MRCTTLGSMKGPAGFVRRLVRAYHRIGSAAAAAIFERGQIRTARIAAPADAGEALYAPSAWWLITRTFKHVRLRQHDVFLDLGSGRGRVVCHVARRYPVQRVIGVEVSTALVQVARANAAAVASRLRAPVVDVVLCDAATYQIPDDVTHIYMYNPFTGRTFDQVIANIIDSLDRRMRPMTLIYVNPRLDDVVVRTGRFSRSAVLDDAFHRPSRRIVVYESRLSSSA